MPPHNVFSVGDGVRPGSWVSGTEINGSAPHVKTKLAGLIPTDAQQHQKLPYAVMDHAAVKQVQCPDLNVMLCGNAGERYMEPNVG